MRRIERDIAKERLFFILFNKPDRFINEHVGAIAIGLFVGILVEQNWTVVSISRVVSKLTQPTPTVDNDIVKALILSSHRVVFAQVPFTEDTRAVASIGKHFGDGGLLRIHIGASDIGIVSTSAVVIPTGHQG